MTDKSIGDEVCEAPIQMQGRRKIPGLKGFLGLPNHVPIGKDPSYSRMTTVASFLSLFLTIFYCQKESKIEFTISEHTDILEYYILSLFLPFSLLSDCTALMYYIEKENKTD